MSRLTLFGLLSFALFLNIPTAGAEEAKGANWPQWRGPNRDGLSSDTGLLKQWPKDGPKLLWETKGAGRGYSSLAIVGGKIYTIGDNSSIADDKDEYLFCFAEATGKFIWKAKIGPAWNNGNADWQSSRSTPTVDDARLYTLSPHGDLVCFNDDGKEQWRKNMKKDFGGRKGDSWGYSESVLIDGDKLVCTPGGDKTTMAALNKKTGDTIWTAAIPEDKGAGHASIVIADVGNTRVYVQSTASGVIGVRATDGKVLWTYSIDKTTAVIPTPIVHGEYVFFTAGYNRGGTLLRQSVNGDTGKVEALYPLNTQIQNKHGGVVMVGDFVYGDGDGGGGKPFCAEAKTGKVMWKTGGSGKGSASVTYADGNLYIRYSNGVMVLVPATPKEYKEVGSFKVPHSGSRPSWSHPVVAGGKLYLREGDFILCYDLRK